MSSPHLAASSAIPQYTLGAKSRIWLTIGVVLGAAGFLAGLIVAPQQAWGGYLMGFVFFTSLALAGSVFLSVLSMSSARWWVALQRIPEAMSSALPVAALLGIGLLLGVHSLYEWSHESVVRQDELLQHKSVWLNTTGFALRLFLIFSLWIFFAYLLRFFAKKVETNAPNAIPQRTKVSAIFLAVFALSFSIASFDWLMSLEPHWFSTMFALLQFASLGAIGVAAAILLALILEKQGALAGILNEEHLHDLGRLLFAITLFWAYCWFCQYMLIWYTNIPEETIHYTHRQEGAWWLLAQTALLLKWAIPFFALLSRRCARSRAVLARVAGLVLAGHAVELFVHVAPALPGGDVSFGIWEFLPVLGMLSLFFLIVLQYLSKNSPVPFTHPYLSDSLSYQIP